MHSYPAALGMILPEEIRAECHKKDPGMTYKSVYGRMIWDDTSPTTNKPNVMGMEMGVLGIQNKNRAITLHEGCYIAIFPHWNIIS